MRDDDDYRTRPPIGWAPQKLTRRSERILTLLACLVALTIAAIFVVVAR